MEARLIIDEPAAGAWNMAVDEALLESAADNERACLRFYRWSEPTLTLGYFQRYGDRRAHASSAARPCVRRTTGGGAILHDDELTYSFAWPARGVGEHTPLYAAFHETVIEELATLGVTATLCGVRRRADPEPFLCFQRRSAGDVMLDDAKICGSAQRRYRGALLQHGSVLFRRSFAAPELPGIEDLAGHSIDVTSLLRNWPSRLADRLDVRFFEAALTAEETHRAEALRTAKFAHPAWNGRR